MIIRSLAIVQANSHRCTAIAGSFAHKEPASKRLSFHFKSISLCPRFAWRNEQCSNPRLIALNWAPKDQPSVWVRIDL